MATRSYNQACAIAGALDLLGERWTLLVVRNLLTGPKRYTDLLHGLEGIGTNLLADRLKSLTEAGMVTQRRLPPPAAARVYELSEKGLELEEPLVELCRWGLRHGVAPGGSATYDVGWSVLAMKAAFRPDRAEGISITCEFHVDDIVFHAAIADGRLTTAFGPATDPQLVLTTDEAGFREMAARQVDVSQLIVSGRAKLEGDPNGFRRFAEVFEVEET